MIHRKAFIGFFMIMLGSWAAVTGCSGNGDAASLEDKLLDQSFNISTAVPEDSLTIDCAADLFELADLLQQTTADPDSFDGDLTGFTINFDDEGYTVDDNGDVLATGTWAALDGNTIEITEDGYTIPYGININGDTIELFLIQESIDAMCDIVENGIAPPYQDPTPHNSSSPDETTGTSSLTGQLDGTWCYQSGYAYYLAITISSEGVDDLDFVELDVLVDTKFEIDAERVVGVNEFLQSAWISTNRLTSDFYRYAPLALDPLDSTSLTVEYGDGKIAVFTKVDAALGEDCVLGDAPLVAPEESVEDPTPAEDPASAT